MNRTYQRWHSPALSRDMELLAFGHAGAPVLAFPTSMGRFYDWEDRGLVGALAEPLERGWLQIFCLDSVDSESWYAKTRPPAERARRHSQYDHYLVQEVLPFVQKQNPSPFLISTGASFGAYHALNFALRHPEHVGRALGMSGLYDIRQFTDGHSDEDVYFNNPCDFIANEHEPQRLAALQRLDIILVIGRDDPNCGNNEYFSKLLREKGIHNSLHIWDGWAHDWPYWDQMLRQYIGGR